MNQHALTSVAEFLNDAGWNYSVFLRSYTTSLGAGASSEQLIHAALSDAAAVDCIEKVTSAEAISEVKSSISYAGDSGAGPDPKAMQSKRFSELLDTLLKETEAAARSAVRIEKFSLSAGHPAYPVFWDFAFLFTGANEAVVFVGSSSD